MEELLFGEEINQEVDFSNIFNKVPITASEVKSPADGLVLSLANRGKVDLSYIAELCHIDKHQVIEELNGAILQNPLTWHEKYDEGWETKEEYLSGNLRNKLIEAEKADKEFPGVFDNNILTLKEMLQEARGLTADEIFVTLGSPWLPIDVVEDFIKYLLKVYVVTVNHDLNTGSWSIETYYNHHDLDTITYGTHRMRAKHIIESTLNQSNIAVTDSVYDVDSGKFKRAKNEKETLLVLEKQKLILDKFHEWIFADTYRKRRLENLYNSIYCTNFTRIYDGSFLKFADLNPKIKLFDYQKNAVARIIFSSNTLLAHDVGSGKTYEMIAAAHELKRMGLSKKNLIVVPNDIVNQWENLYKEMYPQSSILVVRPRHFTPDNKESTLSKIKENDYDAIIMPYSVFDRISLSPDFYKIKLFEEAEKIKKAADYKEDTATTTVVRNYHKYRKAGYLESMLEKIGNKEEDVTYFEDLKIDRLFLDECHNYKNVTIDTNIVALGIATEGSKKCNEMMDKVHYVQQNHNGGGVIFASGTPITNSITDIYNIQRYLQEGELELLKLRNFNSWISNYAEKVDRFEIDVDTLRCRMVRRYSDFKNLPELTSILSNIADFHHIAKDNDLPEFKGYTNVVVEHRPEFLAFLDDISKRADLVRAHKPRLIRPKEADDEKDVYDNMLNITTDGRKAALDIRLFDSSLPFDKKSKVYVCACNVKKIYDQTTSFKGTQLIFCDISTPKETFNIYDELKFILVTMGIPDYEIGYIHDATSDKKRNELFKLVNDGQIRILIGSSFKLATGVNVQNRLIAIHHIDVPWRPSDMVQREGRILRQGNTNEEVYIYRYICENSFDAYSWQILESKQIFIAKLLNNQLDTRVAKDLDDSVLDYAEVKALAVGNPLIEKRVNTQNRLSRLMLINSASLQRREKIRQTLANIDNNKKRWEEEIINTQKDIEVSLLKNNKEELVSDLTKRVLRERLFQALFSNHNDKETLLDNYRGFDILVPPKQYDSENVFIYLKCHHKYYVKLGSSSAGYVIRINNFINKLPDYLKELEERYQNNIQYYKTGQEELEKKEEYQDEIISLQKELEEIDKQIKKENSKHDTKTKTQ